MIYCEDMGEPRIIWFCRSSALVPGQCFKLRHRECANFEGISLFDAYPIKVTDASGSPISFSFS